MAADNAPSAAATAIREEVQVGAKSIEATEIVRDSPELDPGTGEISTTESRYDDAVPDKTGVQKAEDTSALEVITGTEAAIYTESRTEGLQEVAKSEGFLQRTRIDEDQIRRDVSAVVGGLVDSIIARSESTVQDKRFQPQGHAVVQSQELSLDLGKTRLVSPDTKTEEFLESVSTPSAPVTTAIEHVEERDQTLTDTRESTEREDDTAGSVQPQVLDKTIPVTPVLIEEELPESICTPSAPVTTEIECVEEQDTLTDTRESTERGEDAVEQNESATVSSTLDSAFKESGNWLGAGF